MINILLIYSHQYIFFIYYSCPNYFFNIISIQFVNIIIPKYFIRPELTYNRIQKKVNLNELFDFIVSLQDDDFWSNQITQIHVYPNLDVELIPRVGSHIIYLGSVNNAQQKLAKLFTFYKEGLPRVGWNRYTRIDLRYRDQVVCVKPEPAPEPEIKIEN